MFYHSPGVIFISQIKNLNYFEKKSVFDVAFYIVYHLKNMEKSIFTI